MLQALDGIGRWLVHDMGWVSLEILILSVIVYGVTRWGGIQSSRVKRWLWTLVVLKPLTAFLFAWPFPVGIGMDSPIAPIALAPAEAVVNVPSLEDAVLPTDYRVTAPPPTPAVTPRPDAREAPLMERAGQGGITGFAVIGLLWLLGGAGLAAYSLIGVAWLMRGNYSAMGAAGMKGFPSKAS